jgi:hypothetical protein
MNVVYLHICCSGYEVWTHHGKSVCQTAIQLELETNIEHPPTPEVQKFFDILRASEELLHEHMTVSVIGFITRLIVIKSKFSFLNNGYKELLNLINNVLSNNHKMSKNMYQ